MKTSLFFFAAAATAPILILVGLSVPVAISITSVVGIIAMIADDYSPKSTYLREPVKVRAARTERHPFAA